MNKNRQKEMNIPGLSKLKSISCEPSDIEKEISEKQRQKRAFRMAMNRCQNEINSLYEDLEKMQKQARFDKCEGN